MRLRLVIIFGLLAVLSACSDYQKARRAYEVGQFKEALVILERLAAEGDTRAQYEVALMYLQGIGTPIEITKGGKWLLAAANNGNTSAMVEVGGRYETGANTEKNPMVAFTWYRRAAIAGDPIGKFRLAMMYESGEAVPQDFVRAYAWYQLSNNAAARLAVARLSRTMSPADQERAEALTKILKNNPEA